MRRTVLQTAIVLFCLWHMFCVGITSIPRPADDPFSVALRRLFTPIVSPYLQTTSQWQLWDLFAPDPLRRVTLYEIEAKDGDDWKEVVTIKPGTYSFMRHATHFKYFINILDTDNPNLDDAKQTFLQVQCGIYNIAPLTPIRLRTYVTVLPWNTSPVSSAFWRTWTPAFERVIEAGSICPPQS